MIKKKCKDCGTLEAISYNSDCPTCDSDSGWWLTCDEHQEVIFRSEVTECPICVAEARASSPEENERSGLLFSCENCGQKLEIPKELVGHSIECPNCTSKLAISDGVDSEANNNTSKNIYCTNCGEDLEIPMDIADEELECPSCGIELNVRKSGNNQDTVDPFKNLTQPMSSTPAVEMPVYKPVNYLPFTILVTIFCCPLFGIVSIVFATQVNRLYSEGKTQEAIESSKNAKMWAWITFVVGLIYLLIFISIM